MKKLIFLSVAAMFSLTMMAQDTSLNRGSVPPANMQDTIPGNRSQKDSSNWKSDPNNKRGIDSTLDQRSDSSKLNPPDTASTANQDLRADKSSQDTLASANKPEQKQQSTQADSAAATTTTEVVTDRIVMRNDSLLIIQNGEAAPLDKEYKLQSGAIVNADGSVKFPSGKTVQLKNGQFIELSTPDDSKTDKKKSKGKKKTKTEA